MSERGVPTQLTGAPPLEIETRPSDHGTLVVVSGAIDLVTEQALHNGLRQALARSDRGIDLDLTGVDFCDCSGLNVLLRLRGHALDEGKTITVRAAGTAVLRLLSLTGTLPLFIATGEDEAEDESEDEETGAEITSLGSLGSPGSLGEVDQDLRIEVVQLRRAMQTRPVIDLARGVLMASFGLSADDAWQVLVSVSQNTNTKLHEVADSLVGAVTGDDVPESFQGQIAETVTRLRATPEDQ
ncbi:ANTAR domain-containing protein [Streptomyces sp. NPDC002680]|uniref:ANTAR domain-containing protein n=1 Tax=Streptomyces sp. NPDC002680 TaxID=3364659 RepID=UPI003690A71E